MAWNLPGGADKPLPYMMRYAKASPRRRTIAITHCNERVWLTVKDKASGTFEGERILGNLNAEARRR